MHNQNSFIGRGLVFLLICLLLVTGCSGSQTNSASTEAPGTIFGQLSQLVQLGSTEETLTYKLQVGSFFVTMRGEVLLNRPVYIDTIVTERESGAVRDDVVVTLDLCHAVDEDIFSVGSCTEFDDPLYQHQLTPTFQGGLYHAEGFEWQRSDNWNGTVTITTPESGESETVDIGFYVYPERPASTNLFELISISLPFVVIGLFLLGILRMGGLSVLQRAT